MMPVVLVRRHDMFSKTLRPLLALLLLASTWSIHQPLLAAAQPPPNMSSTDPAYEPVHTVGMNNKTCTVTGEMNLEMAPLHDSPWACVQHWTPRHGEYTVSLHWLLEPEARIAHFEMQVIYQQAPPPSNVGNTPRFVALSFPTGPCRHPTAIRSPGKPPSLSPEQHINQRVMPAECNMYPADAVMARWDPRFDGWRVAAYRMDGRVAESIIRDANQTRQQTASVWSQALSNHNMTILRGANKNTTVLFDTANITGTWLRFSRPYANGGRVELFNTTLKDMTDLPEEGQKDNFVVQHVNWAVGPVGGGLGYHNFDDRGSLALLASTGPPASASTDVMLDDSHDPEGLGIAG